MIKIFTNPFLADFIQVAANLPEDERAQIEAMSGEKFTIDGAALGNFLVPGPKWVAKIGATEEEFASGLATPIAVGGFAPQRPGVWRDFLMNTPAAFDNAHWFALTRACRRAMDAMFISGQAHRLECLVPAPRVQSRPELAKWYRVLGYNEEGLRYGYCANGTDAIAYSRVKH